METKRICSFIIVLTLWDMGFDCSLLMLFFSFFVWVHIHLVFLCILRFTLLAREFVSSVWCIKILSPQEVQEMGKQGLELLNSVPIQKLSNSNCDDYGSRQGSRNLRNGIASLGSLDYWNHLLVVKTQLPSPVRLAILPIRYNHVEGLPNS